MTRQPVNSTWEYHKPQINTIKTTLQNKILQRYANRCNTARNVRVGTFQTVTGLMSQQSTNSNCAEWCRLSLPLQSQSWRLTADFAGSVVILSKSNRLLTFATLHFASLYRKTCCLILALCLQNFRPICPIWVTSCCSACICTLIYEHDSWYYYNNNFTVYCKRKLRKSNSCYWNIKFDLSLYCSFIHTFCVITINLFIYFLFKKPTRNMCVFKGEHEVWVECH